MARFLRIPHCRAPIKVQSGDDPSATPRTSNETDGWSLKLPPADQTRLLRYVILHSAHLARVRGRYFSVCAPRISLNALLVFSFRMTGATLPESIIDEEDSVSVYREALVENFYETT